MVSDVIFPSKNPLIAALLKTEVGSDAMNGIPYVLISPASTLYGYLILCLFDCGAPTEF
jgi:hypothetical protein